MEILKINRGLLFEYTYSVVRYPAIHNWHLGISSLLVIGSMGSNGCETSCISVEGRFSEGTVFVDFVRRMLCSHNVTPFSA